MKRLVTIVGFLFLTGCASTYQTTANMKMLQASLSKPQATKILRDVILSPKKVPGPCELKDKKVKLNPSGFEYVDYKIGEKIGQETRYGKVYNVYKKEFFTQSREFDDIATARVLVNNDQMCAGRIKGDYVLILSYSLTGVYTVGVSRQNMDSVLAALTVISPDVRIIEGIGF